MGAKKLCRGGTWPVAGTKQLVLLPAIGGTPLKRLAALQRHRAYLWVSMHCQTVDRRECIRATYLFNCVYDAKDSRPAGVRADIGFQTPCKQSPMSRRPIDDLVACYN